MYLIAIFIKSVPTTIITPITPSADPTQQTTRQTNGKTLTFTLYRYPQPAAPEEQNDPIGYILLVTDPADPFLHCTSEIRTWKMTNPLFSIDGQRKGKRDDGGVEAVVEECLMGCFSEPERWVFSCRFHRANFGWFPKLLC